MPAYRAKGEGGRFKTMRGLTFFVLEKMNLGEGIQEFNHLRVLCRQVSKLDQGKQQYATLQMTGCFITFNIKLIV
jgi:hypothetical protein